MQQPTPLLPAELLIRIAEDESDRAEKVGLAGPIAADDDVVVGREGVRGGRGGVSVGFEACRRGVGELRVRSLG